MKHRLLSWLTVILLLLALCVPSGAVAESFMLYVCADMEMANNSNSGGGVRLLMQ